MRRHIFSLFILIALAAFALPACESGSNREPADPSKSSDKDPPKKSDHGADADVTIETVPVSGNIYMLIGRGGNIGVSVGEDGILIIDDQFANIADKIRAALSELSKGKLEFILNTHHHGDHTGSNEVFAEEATIIAHDNVRANLVSQNKSPATLPIVTFDKTLTVHFNGETIRATHFPRGHTSGDSIIFFEESNVIHMGDHFFNGRFPFIDLDSGGDVLSYAENVKSVLDSIKPDTKIIPGHGALATRGDLEKFHGMMVETVGIVRGQMEKGKSVDAIKKQGLPAKWNDWGTGFIKTDKWIETIYKSLGK